MTPSFEELAPIEFARRLRPDQEEIAALARRYWEERQRSRQPGSALDDWLRAEAEIIRRREAAIDEASEESFPASDPPAH
jgi:hypothetical protein